MELRTIADVGLAGYPNAGKSTLLGCLTSAKPKVALYPFTTLSPVVGQVEYSVSLDFASCIYGFASTVKLVRNVEIALLVLVLHDYACRFRC